MDPAFPGPVSIQQFGTSQFGNFLSIAAVND